MQPNPPHLASRNERSIRRRNSAALAAAPQAPRAAADSALDELKIWRSDWMD